MIKRIEYIIKHNSVVQKAYILIFSTLFKALGFFVKTKRNQVLFQSLIGKNYGDSPKVLFDAMKSDPSFKGFKYVWAFDEPQSFKVTGARKVKLNSIKYFITALQSGIWVTNVNIERGLHFKPQKTIYINTWHGCAPLKVDGNAQKNRNDYDFSDVDIFCSNSKWWDECFIKNFKVRRNNIIRCGLPRNDTLFKVTQEEIKRIKDSFDIPHNKKVILYAPTWRETSNGNQNGVIKPPINIVYWETKLSDKYIVLFRMHHLTNNAMNITFNDFVRDCSGDYDINDLIKISDILVTDYSSTLADYSILEKPALFFAYDYDEYYKNRGLYFRLEELLPGCVCKTEDELIERIITLDYKRESNKVKRLKHNFVYNKDNSTEICMKALKKCVFSK